MAVRPRLAVARVHRQADAARRVGHRPRPDDDRVFQRVDRRAERGRDVDRRIVVMGVRGADDAGAAADGEHVAGRVLRAGEERRRRGCERGGRRGLLRRRERPPGRGEPGRGGVAPLGGVHDAGLEREPVGEKRRPGRGAPAGGAASPTRRSAGSPPPRRAARAASRFCCIRSSEKVTCCRPCTDPRAAAPRSRTSRRGCTRRRRAGGRCPRPRRRGSARRRRSRRPRSRGRRRRPRSRPRPTRATSTA